MLGVQDAEHQNGDDIRYRFDVRARLKKLRLQELAEDVGEDAAVLVVADFDGAVDAADDAEYLRVAGIAAGADGETFARRDAFFDAFDVVGLGAVEAEGLGVFAGLELEREDAHADEIAAVDA